MAEIPEELKRNSRPKDEIFAPDEYLFRRVEPDLWRESGVDIDAVMLPNMSVYRQKYSLPEWALLESDQLADWAVVGFKVRDLPSPLMHLGVQLHTFEPRHIPLDENYAHSEVWAFRDGVHIHAKRDIDRILHARWRERLVTQLRTFVRPKERPTSRS